LSFIFRLIYLVFYQMQQETYSCERCKVLLVFLFKIVGFILY